MDCLNRHCLSVVQTERHFYFFLLSLSLVRKTRNATIKLPKVANNVRIPMKIEITSNAVISRTSFPMYSQLARVLVQEVATLSWILFLEHFCSIGFCHIHNHIINTIKFQLIYIYINNICITYYIFSFCIVSTIFFRLILFIEYCVVANNKTNTAAMAINMPPYGN